MSIINNAISFKRLRTGNLANSVAVSSWITSLLIYTRNPLTGEYYCPVVKSPVRLRVGQSYHKWIAAGEIEHVRGFDKANHFIKLPISWLDETFDTITTDAYTDENGNEVAATTTTITNLEHYKQVIRHKNTTHCLVKITDSNYDALKTLFANDFSNVYTEEYYFKKISESYVDEDGVTQVGEFYVAPKITEL